MTAIPFSLEDLAENKQGKMTAAQRSHLKSEFSASANMGKNIAVVLWVVFVLLVIVILAVGLPGELTARYTGVAAKKDPGSMQWTVLALAFVAMAAAGITSLFALIAQKGLRNLDANLPVYSVVGMAEKSVLENYYTLKIGDREFVYSDADDLTYNAFDDGRSYTAYYIFNTANIIVSAEITE